jgi:hypothetical protein
MMYDLAVSPVNRVQQHEPFSSRKLHNEAEAKTAPFKNEDDTYTNLHYAAGIAKLGQNNTPGRTAEDDAKQRIIDELRTIDAQVHAHEMAHLAAAGAAASSGPTYVYVTGPDGKAYAVGGEVSISLSSVPGSLEATVEKARAIRAAALAPSDPSAQDLAVAAAATQMEMAALAELSKQRVERMEAMSETRDKLRTWELPGSKAVTHSPAHAYLHRNPEPLIDLYA